MTFPSGTLLGSYEIVARIFLKTWNGFRPLANEPRFQALLAQVGLE